MNQMNNRSSNKKRSIKCLHNKWNRISMIPAFIRVPYTRSLNSSWTGASMNTKMLMVSQGTIWRLLIVDSIFMVHPRCNIHMRPRLRLIQTMSGQTPLIRMACSIPMKLNLLMMILHRKEPNTWGLRVKRVSHS